MFACRHLTCRLMHGFERGGACPGDRPGSLTTAPGSVCKREPGRTQGDALTQIVGDSTGHDYHSSCSRPFFTLVSSQRMEFVEELNRRSGYYHPLEYSARLDLPPG